MFFLDCRCCCCASAAPILAPTCVFHGLLLLLLVAVATAAPILAPPPTILVDILVVVLRHPVALRTGASLGPARCPRGWAGAHIVLPHHAEHCCAFICRHIACLTCVASCVFVDCAEGLNPPSSMSVGDSKEGDLDAVAGTCSSVAAETQDSLDRDLNSVLWIRRSSASK